MAASYMIIVRDPSGNKLADLTRFAKLDYVLTENAVGSLTLTLGEEIPPDWTTRDTRLEVWRSVDGAPAALEGEAVWFVRQPIDDLAASGELTHTLTAHDANDLLKRRIVAYKATTSQSTKTAAYDDMAKAIVRENLGNLATDTLRDLSAYLSVDADQSACPSALKSFAYRNVLTVLQEIAAASAGAGTYLSFDITRVNDSQLVFRTYMNQRGIDHRFPTSPNPVLLSPESGTLANASIKYDYTLEVTAAYAGGKGQNTARDFEVAVDARAFSSPFNRIEAFLDMANADPTEIPAQLLAELWAGRPRKHFTGRIDESPGVRYGVHYGHGDIVTAAFRNQSFNCRVTPVHVTVSEQGEVIDAQLNGDALIS